MSWALSRASEPAPGLSHCRRHPDESDYKPATIALKLVAVRKLLVWAQEEQLAPLLTEGDLDTRTRNGHRTPLAAPRVRQEPVQYLDFGDLEKLLAAPFSLVRKDGSLRENALRDAVILSLLALRGLREGKLTRLTAAAFEPRGDGALLRIRGKGRKQRQIDLDPDLWVLVQAHMRQRQADTGPPPGAPLFVGQRGPITVQGIISVVRRHGQRALGRSDVTPHTLRRTFATLASRELRDEHGNVIKPAMPPYVLQRLLGHEHLSTTQRYVEAAAEADRTPTDVYLPVGVPAPGQDPDDASPG